MHIFLFLCLYSYNCILFYFFLEPLLDILPSSYFPFLFPLNKNIFVL